MLEENKILKQQVNVLLEDNAALWDVRLENEKDLKAASLNEFQLNSELFSCKESMKALENKCYVMNAMMDDMTEGMKSYDLMNLFVW